MGINKIHATAQVHSLKSVNDFSGKYFEVESSGTVVAGGGAIAVENEKVRARCSLQNNYAPSFFS